MNGIASNMPRARAGAVVTQQKALQPANTPSRSGAMVAQLGSLRLSVTKALEKHVNIKLFALAKQAGATLGSITKSLSQRKSETAKPALTYQTSRASQTPPEQSDAQVADERISKRLGDTYTGETREKITRLKRELEGLKEDKEYKEIRYNQSGVGRQEKEKIAAYLPKLDKKIKDTQKKVDELTQKYNQAEEGRSAVEKRQAPVANPHEATTESPIWTDYIQPARPIPIEEEVVLSPSPTPHRRGESATITGQVPVAEEASIRDAVLPPSDEIVFHRATLSEEEVVSYPEGG